MKMIKLFLTFLKVGLLGFGGGLSMLPYLEEVAQVKAGLKDQDFLQIMAIAQAFPGAMGINVAAIIGYRMATFPGAILAILGVTIPGIICVILLFYIIGSAAQFPLIQDLLNSLKAAMVGLILGMVVNLGRRSWTGVKAVLLGLTAFFLFYLFKANPVLILVIAAVAGYLLPAKEV